MSGTQSQYLAGEKAARVWLNTNEGFYSQMISDDLLLSVVKIIVDAAVHNPIPPPNANT